MTRLPPSMATKRTALWMRPSRSLPATSLAVTEIAEVDYASRLPDAFPTAAGQADGDATVVAPGEPLAPSSPPPLLRATLVGAAPRAPRVEPPREPRALLAPAVHPRAAWHGAGPSGHGALAPQARHTLPIPRAPRAPTPLVRSCGAAPASRMGPSRPQAPGPRGSQPHATAEAHRPVRAPLPTHGASGPRGGAAWNLVRTDPPPVRPAYRATISRRSLALAALLVLTCAAATWRGASLSAPPEPRDAATTTVTRPATPPPSAVATASTTAAPEAPPSRGESPASAPPSAAAAAAGRTSRGAKPLTLTLARRAVDAVAADRPLEAASYYEQLASADESDPTFAVAARALRARARSTP